MGSDICKILGIEFHSYSRERVREAKLESIKSTDYIDIRLYDLKRIRNKPRFLGLNPEYLSVSIPRLTSCNFLQLKLRIEQIVRIFLPKRILSYISIDTRERRGLFFRSKAINRDVLTSNLRKLQPVLFKQLSSVERDALSSLAKVERVAVVFPLLEQFGGDNQYHERMFGEILIELDANGVQHVLVKNHPTDSRDFSELAQKHFKSKKLHSIPPKLNILPVEIILTLFKFDLYGTFSTAMLGLNHLSLYPAKLYLPQDKPWRNFLTYAQSSQYALIDHKLKYV